MPPKLIILNIIAGFTALCFLITNTSPELATFIIGIALGLTWGYRLRQ